MYFTYLAKERPSTNLRAELAGRHHQVHTHCQQDQDQTSPGDQALGAQLVDLAVRGPLVGGVDRGVAIHVGAVLVLEAVHAIALALAALGVPPVLLLHVAGAAHQVLLHHIVLDAVQALGADVNLLTARSHGLHHLLSAGPQGQLGLDCELHLAGGESCHCCYCEA